MPDKRSPIADMPSLHRSPPISDASAAALLSDQDPGALMQFAGWGDFADQMTGAFDVLGLTGLGDYRNVQRAGRCCGFRIAPNRLLVGLEDAGVLAHAALHLDPAAIAVLDLSHARWTIGIEGPAAPECLARLAPIDFAADAFPVETFVQTGVDGIHVLIHRQAEQRFSLQVPYTWAAALMDLAREAAASAGYRVESGGHSGTGGRQ